MCVKRLKVPDCKLVSDFDVGTSSLLCCNKNEPKRKAQIVYKEAFIAFPSQLTLWSEGGVK